MIDRTQTTEEIEIEKAELLEGEGQLRQFPALQMKEELAPAREGPAPTDLEIMRHLVRMIRQFLLGKTIEEIEAEMAKTRVETAERTNVVVHQAAIDRLRQMADDLDPAASYPLELPPLANFHPRAATANQALAMQRLSATLTSGPKIKFQ